MVKNSDLTKKHLQASDTLIRFLLPEARVRGAIIRASHLRAEACRIHGLAEGARHAPGELFAQTLIASILLLSISKGGVRQVLQIDGNQGPVSRILAETRGNHGVRGYLDWHDGISSHGQKTSPLSWLGSPVSISTVRDLGFGQPYISTIHSEAEFLADMLVEYLNKSVQIRADILLHHDTGLILEAMPGCKDEHWLSAIKTLVAIPNKTFDDEAENVLKAFDSLGLNIVGRDTYSWRCDCDGESMARMLAKMPTDTLCELQDADGKITVSCRYCGKSHSLKPTT